MVVFGGPECARPITVQCKFLGRVACDFLSEGHGKSSVNPPTAYQQAPP